MPQTAALELAPERYREPLRETLERYQITNPTEFLATVYYESNYLSSLTENLNYTCDALLKRFSRKRISYEEAMRLGRSNRHPAYQEAIANVIYGGAYGMRELGNIHQGDGWHYRGQGPIQLTGRGNWEAFGEHMGRADIAENPALALKDPLLTCFTSGWFWTHHKRLNVCGDDLRAITKKVTGAPDTAIKTRAAYRDRLLQLEVA